VTPLERLLHGLAGHEPQAATLPVDEQCDAVDLGELGQRVDDLRSRVDVSGTSRPPAKADGRGSVHE
jgi:hypothetical protein